MEELLAFVDKYASLLVSLVAIALTLYGGHATRRHNKLSLLPRLAAFAETKEDAETGITTYEVTLKNSGIGPAIIQQYHILLDGVAIPVNTPDDFFKAIRAAVPAEYDPLPTNYFGILRKGFVMAKDSATCVVKVGIKNATLEHSEALKRFQMRVLYESAYGELSIYDTRTHTDEVTGWQAVQLHARALFVSLCDMTRALANQSWHTLANRRKPSQEVSPGPSR